MKKGAFLLGITRVRVTKHTKNYRDRLRNPKHLPQIIPLNNLGISGYLKALVKMTFKLMTKVPELEHL